MANDDEPGDEASFDPEFDPTYATAGPRRSTFTPPPANLRNPAAVDSASPPESAAAGAPSTAAGAPSTGDATGTAAAQDAASHDDDELASAIAQDFSRFAPPTGPISAPLSVFDPEAPFDLPPPSSTPGGAPVAAPPGSIRTERQYFDSPPTTETAPTPPSATEPPSAPQSWGQAAQTSEPEPQPVPSRPAGSASPSFPQAPSEGSAESPLAPPATAPATPVGTSAALAGGANPVLQPWLGAPAPDPAQAVDLPSVPAARPVRRSLPDEQLQALVNGAAGQPGSTLEVIEELETQLRLREAEAKQFTAWQASMLAIGTPDAIAALEEVRAEFTGLGPTAAAKPAGPSTLAAPATPVEVQSADDLQEFPASPDSPPTAASPASVGPPQAPTSAESAEETAMREFLLRGTSSEPETVSDAYSESAPVDSAEPSFGIEQDASPADATVREVWELDQPIDEPLTASAPAAAAALPPPLVEPPPFGGIAEPAIRVPGAAAAGPAAAGPAAVPMTEPAAPQAAEPDAAELGAPRDLGFVYRGGGVGLEQADPADGFEPPAVADPGLPIVPAELIEPGRPTADRGPSADPEFFGAIPGSSAAPQPPLGPPLGPPAAPPPGPGVGSIPPTPFSFDDLLAGSPEGDPRDEPGFEAPESVFIVPMAVAAGEPEPTDTDSIRIIEPSVQAELDDEVDETDRAFPGLAASGATSAGAAAAAFAAQQASPPSAPIPITRIPENEVVLTVNEPIKQPVFSLELSGLEPTPVEQRVGRSARLFWLWFAANSGILSLALGATIFGLGVSLRQAIVGVLAGVALSFLPLGLTTLAGKRSGQPTMVVSRATFGVIGNVIPAIFALVTRVFWGAVLLWLLATATVIVLVGAELDGGLGEGLILIIALGAGLMLAGLIAVIGYSLFARIQLILSILTALLLVGLVVLTASYIDIEQALTTPDGPWILSVAAAVLVFSFVGLAWANSGADLARYQRPGSSGASSMLWATFGATLPSFFIIGYGALLSASNAGIASGFATSPLDTLSLMLPSWYPVPLLAAVGLSLLSGVTITLYSGGFAFQAIGVRMSRQTGVVAVALLVAAVAILITFGIAGGVAELFRDLATTLAVPTAAWAGIFAAEMMIRNRRFETDSLLARGGVYPNVNWVNLIGLVVITVIGLGLTSATVSWLGWQGYLYGLLGVPLDSDLAATDLGVLIALGLGLLVPIVFGIPSIRRQEAARV